MRQKSETYDCDRLNSSIVKNVFFIKPFEESGKEVVLLQLMIFNSFSEINLNCLIYFDYITGIEVIPKSKLILDSSFNINGLNLHPTEFVSFHFANLKGTDVNLNLQIKLKYI